MIFFNKSNRYEHNTEEMDKEGMSKQEDLLLLNAIGTSANPDWEKISSDMQDQGLIKTPKQCRERYP